MTEPSSGRHRLMQAGMRFRIGAVLLLCVATLALFGFGARYMAVTPGIIPAIGDGGWGASRFGVGVTKTTPPVIALTAQGGNNGRFPFLVSHLDDPGRFALVRVAAEIASRNLKQGDEHWRQGRILLFSLDQRGRRLRHLESEVGAVAGAAGWRRVALVVPVETATARIRVTIYNAGKGGVMLVRNLTIDAVAETAWFTILSRLLMVLWAAAALWSLAPLVARPGRRVLSAATVAVGLMILAGTLTPQPGWSNFLQPVRTPMVRFAEKLLVGVEDMLAPASKTEGEGGTSTVGASRPGGDPGGGGGAARRNESTDRLSALARIGLGRAPPLHHFGAFLLLGLVAAGGFSAASRWSIAGYLAAFAIAAETLQMFSYTRSTALDDYLWNLAGAAAGMAAVWAARRLRRRTSNGVRQG